MENYDYSSSAKPSLGMLHGVETKHASSATNMLYVRTGNTAKDKVFTDLGTFSIATEGIPGVAGAATQIIGELWVTYRIKLSRANLYGSLIGGNILNSYCQNVGSAAQMYVSTTAKATNSFNVSFTAIGATSCTMSFPSRISLGSFFIEVYMITAASVTHQLVLPTSPTLMTIWRPQQSLPSATVTHHVGPTIGSIAATNSTSISNFYCTINAPGNTFATIVLNVSAAAPGTTEWHVNISQVSQLPSLALA